MTGRRALFVVSAAQLLAQGVGLALALRRRLPYDVRLVRMRGRPEDVARDAWDKGTALSAPVQMLAVHAVALAALPRRAGTVPARVLGVLGALYVGGYLGERLVRARLRPAGWEPAESTVAAAGTALAATMAVLASRSTTRRHERRP